MKIAALGLAAALAASSAQATETFDFTMAGNGVTLVDGNVCCVGLPDGLVVSFQWTGVASVTTTSGADGVYSGADLLSFSAHASMLPPVQYAYFGFDFATDGTGAHSYFALNPPVVTIAGGQVVAIEASGTMLPDPALHLTFDGLGVREDGFIFRVGETHAGGTLVQMSPVPEPETWALLVAGLGVVGMVRRKSRGA